MNITSFSQVFWLLVFVWSGFNNCCSSCPIETTGDEEIKSILRAHFSGPPLSPLKFEVDEDRDSSPQRPKGPAQKPRKKYYKKKKVVSHIHFQTCHTSENWRDIFQHLISMVRPKAKKLPILFVDMDDTLLTMHPIERFAENYQAFEEWDRGNHGNDAFIDGFFTELQSKLPPGVIFTKDDLQSFVYYYRSFFQEAYENPSAVCTTTERFLLHQLMEHKVLQYLELLSKAGWLICGLTSRQSHSMDFSHAQLKSLGIDLRKLNLKHPSALTSSALLNPFLTYSNYIFFTNGSSKNVLMGRILNFLASHYPHISRFVTAHVDDNYTDQLSVMPLSFKAESQTVEFETSRPLMVTHHPIYYTKDDRTIAQDHRNSIMALVKCPKFIAAVQEFYQEVTSKPEINWLADEDGSKL